MKLRGPRIEIDNTDGDKWLVTLSGFIGNDLENFTISVLVDRSDASMRELVQEAVARAIGKLKSYQAGNAETLLPPGSTRS
jgi:hypothetical protein